MRHLRTVAGSLAILLCTASFGQETTLSTPDLHFFSIIVGNMDTSLEWYRDVADFKLVDSFSDEDRGIKMANLANGYARLELIEINSAISTEVLRAQYGTNARIGGFFKIGFRVKEFDQWVARLESLGVTFSGTVVSDPQTEKRMLVLLDPDGNRIQFFER